MMKKLLIGIAVIGVLGAAYGLYLYNKEVPSLESATAVASLSAQEIFTQFEEDETAANEKYLGKVVEINGEVVSVDKESGLFNVSLKSGSDFGMVNCKLDSNYNQVDIEPNQSVTLKCQCNGMLLDVVLNRCVVVKN